MYHRKIVDEYICDVCKSKWVQEVEEVDSPITKPNWLIIAVSDGSEKKEYLCCSTGCATRAVTLTDRHSKVISTTTKPTNLMLVSNQIKPTINYCVVCKVHAVDTEDGLCKECCCEQSLFFPK